MKVCRVPAARLLAAALVLAGCAGRPEVRLADHWRVDLSQARQQLEELAAGEGHGVPAGYTLANLASLYDAELPLLLFREQLDAACPGARRQHVEAQIAWLEGRDEKVRAAADEYAGGTLAAVAAARARIDATRERLDELRRRPLPACGGA